MFGTSPLDNLAPPFAANGTRAPDHRKSGQDVGDNDASLLIWSRYSTEGVKFKFVRENIRQHRSRSVSSSYISSSHPASTDFLLGLKPNAIDWKVSRRSACGIIAHSFAAHSGLSLEHIRI